MSEDGEKTPQVNLAEDLNLSADYSGSDEAVVAVTSPEAAMDQGEDVPPVGPRPEPSTAAAAVEEDRPSPAVATAAATPTFPPHTPSGGKAALPGHWMPEDPTGVL